MGPVAPYQEAAPACVIRHRSFLLFRPSRLQGTGYQRWELAGAEVAPERPLALDSGFLNELHIFLIGLQNREENLLQSKCLLLITVSLILKVLNEDVFNVVKVQLLLTRCGLVV